MADCLKVAEQVADGRLDDDELEEIFADLNSRKQRAMAGEGLTSVEAEMMDAGRVIAADARLAALIEKRGRLKNIVVENRLLDLVERANAATDNPALGLEAAISGVNAPFTGAQKSVDALTGGLMNQYVGGLIADLKAANLLTSYNKMSETLEREVARAISHLNLPDDVRAVTKLNAGKDAMKIAEIMHKYQKASVRRLNREGGYIREKQGRVVRQNHNPERMARAGQEAWKDFVRGRIDFQKMGVEPGKIEDFLDSAYTSIRSGVRLNKEVNDVERAFKGPGNIAKKDAASRLIEFKSVDDWLDYDKEFGTGSLREAYQQDLQRAARNTALMQNFGTNPEAMLDRIIELSSRKFREDPAKLKPFQKPQFLKNRMAEVTGDVNLGADATIAKVGAAFRAWQTMAKLGGSVISAFSDVGFMATNRIYQGQSLMDGWGDAVKAPMEGMSKGDKRVYADLMGAGLEGQLGDFMSRFNAADDATGRVSKLMGQYFKLNLLGPWSDSNKRGVTLILSRDFAMKAAQDFGALPEATQRLLRIYDIDAKQWDVLRKGVRKADDGREYLLPGDVRGTSGDTRLEDEAIGNFFSLLSSEADFAVPSPGARERAILRQGLRPDTIEGQAIRSLVQFKAFGVTGLTKVMGRQVYGHGAKSLRDQLARGVGANVGLANAVVGATVLGYFVMQFKEVLKGRELRPATKETFIAAALQGGGLGIYGDFLFGEASRFGGGTLETLAGPTVGTLTETVDLLQRARGVVFGGDEDLRGDTLRLVKSNIPFANLFYTKAAMDYLVWYHLQEMINPGYLRRAERRVKREQNQEYWLPPSSVIATGGGFK